MECWCNRPEFPHSPFFPAEKREKLTGEELTVLHMKDIYVNYAEPVVGLTFIIIMFYKTCEQSCFTPCGRTVNGFGHSIHNCIG